MVRPVETFGKRNTHFHLYSNENRGHTKDYMFFDRMAQNYIEFGGSVFYVYRLQGYRNADGSIADLNTIQDPVLMENPNGRVYSKDVIPIWAFTKIDRNIFEQMAWGLNLSSSEITEIVLHYNSMIEKIGRKLIAGDIIEVGFLKDVDLLDPDARAITRFFKVDSSQKFRGTYDPHYQMHLWSISVSPLTDSPEYADVFDPNNPKVSHGGGSGTEDDGNNGNGAFAPDDEPQGPQSQFDKEVDIMDKLLEEAEEAVPYLGTTVHQLYIEVDELTGKPKVYDYIYEAWSSDGVPPNQNPDEVQYGKTFPQNPEEGQYFLRVDYERPRLYYRTGGIWSLVEYDNRPKWSGIPELLKYITEDETKFLNNEHDVENHRQNLREVAMSRAIYRPAWKK